MKYKILHILLVLTFLSCGGSAFSQGKVIRQNKETNGIQKTDSKRNQYEEKRNQEEAAKRKQEEDITEIESVKRELGEEIKQMFEEEVKFSQETGVINDHEWVDLGLPSGLKWATCNVGATLPEDYGDYFAWGETKTSYNENNSPTYNISIYTLLMEGIINSSGILNRSYDAAYANWGSSWRMPTKSDFDELFSKCKLTRIIKNGKNGYLVSGPNGKSIFLPAAGGIFGSSITDTNNIGYYWSSHVTDVDSIYSGNIDANYYAHCLYLSESYYYITHRSGKLCLSVRPVTE